FSEAMNAATVNGSTILLRDANNAAVSATVTYNISTRTATLDPTADLASGAAYSVLVTGGTNGVKDVAGNTLAADFASAFTTLPPVLPAAPAAYQLLATKTPATTNAGDGSPLELGVKFKSDQ